LTNVMGILFSAAARNCHGHAEMLLEKVIYMFYKTKPVYLSRTHNG